MNRFDFTAVSKRLSCLPDLQTLAARFKSRQKPIPTTEEHPIHTQAQCHTLVTTLSQAPMISITASAGDGIALSVASGTTYTISLDKLPDMLPILQPILIQIPKLIYHATAVIPLLTQMGVEIAPLTFDPMMADDLLHPGTQAARLDDLAWRWLDCDLPVTDKVISADVALRLYAPLQQAIKRHGLRDVLELEMALVPVLASMEATGIGMDMAFWRQMRQQADGRLHTLATTIQQQVGIPFDVRSSQAMCEALFGHLGLPTEGKRGDTYTITKATLLKLRPHAPDLIPLILAYREWTYLKHRYLDVLPEKAQNGRLHTRFDQLGAVTGRITSYNPNLQNIPIRSENGCQLRRGFVARPGWVLLGADYAQFELRLLAHLSQDENLLAILRQGGDVHRLTAATVYDIPPEAVTADQRRLAKTINFGLLYGMGVSRLAREMGVSKEEATTFIVAYDGRFPGVRAYLKATKARAKRQGYLQTLLGRRRWFPTFENREVRGSREWQQAERGAMNYPLQGGAADIIKLAMVRLYETLAGDYQAQMILQIHDELLLEVPEEEVEAVTAVVRAVMADAYPLDVPLAVKVKTGGNWFALGNKG